MLMEALAADAVEDLDRDDVADVGGDRPVAQGLEEPVRGRRRRDEGEAGVVEPVALAAPAAGAPAESVPVAVEVRER